MFFPRMRITGGFWRLRFQPGPTEPPKQKQHKSALAKAGGDSWAFPVFGESWTKFDPLELTSLWISKLFGSLHRLQDFKKWLSNYPMSGVIFLFHQVKWMQPSGKVSMANWVSTVSEHHMYWNKQLDCMSSKHPTEQPGEIQCPNNCWQKMVGNRKCWP